MQVDSSLYGDVLVGLAQFSQHGGYRQVASFCLIAFHGHIGSALEEPARLTQSGPTKLTIRRYYHDSKDVNLGNQ